MKRYLTLLSILLPGLLFVAPAYSFAKIKVFACEPEWAALAEEIGGDKVEVFAATSAMQDPHYIRARPSLISRARNADLLLCSGASLEIGWLPILRQKARSDRQPGAIGSPCLKFRSWSTAAWETYIRKATPMCT